MGYWLVKTEPESYNWDNLKADGNAMWDGVRNYQARNFMQEMQVGDPVLIYYSGKEREVMGIAEVVREAYPDPTAETPDKWVAVDLKAIKKLPQPVSLATIKSDPTFAEMKLVKNSRLSVMPVEKAHFEAIINYSEEA